MSRISVSSTTIFNLALFVDRLTFSLPPCLYGLGVVLLLGKMWPFPAWVDTGVLVLAVGVALLFVMLTGAALKGWRWFDAEHARAWMDWRNQAGGRIISATDDVEAVADNCMLRIFPAISLGTFLKSLIWPLLFVVVVTLLPNREVKAGTSSVSLGQTLARVERELEQAALDACVSESDAEQLREQLVQVRELAEQSPEAAAEALDALLGRLAQAEAKRLNTMGEALEAAADLQVALQSGVSAGTGAATQAEKSIQALNEALQQFAQDMGGQDKLSPEMTSVLNDAAALSAAVSASGQPSQLSPAAVQAMLATLSQQAQTLTSQPPAMGSNARVSSSRAEAEGRLGAARQSLEALLALEGEGSAGGNDAVGAGGVGRGRNDAAMIFGQPADASGLDVDYRPLSRNEVAGGMEELLQRERVRPREELVAEDISPVGAGFSAVPDQVAAGRSGGELSPEREKAARRYFEAMAASQKQP